MVLALLTTFGVGAALYMQYSAINTDLEALQSRAEVLEQVGLISEIVHSLQKERGLSAGFLVDRDETHQKRLRQHRLETDEQLLGLDHQSRLFFFDAKWLASFILNLADKRKEIDDEAVDWKSVRTFYTDAITHLLDAVTAKILDGGRFEQGQKIMAFISLAQARECLGLIRASISRVHKQGRTLPEDIKVIAGYYGAFGEHRRAFIRDLRGTGDEAVLDNVFSSDFRAVVQRVESVLGFERGPADNNLAKSWWEDATRVIDTMKVAESSLFDSMRALISERILEKQQVFRVYVSVSLAIAALVVFLAFATMLRILKAMAVLLKTLKQVMTTQDFNAKVPIGPSVDEFGELGLSINNLLSYTDTLIKKKDFLANTDLLTGIHNRRSFLDGVNREFDRVRRYGGGIGLAVCDIDHFKAVNDKHGHEVGDLILKEFSNVLRVQVRKSDLVGRWGGEEFVVLAPETKQGDLITLAEKLRSSVAQTDFPTGEPVTCSIGTASLHSEETFEALFERADKALYQAKNNGRNRVESAN